MAASVYRRRIVNIVQCARSIGNCAHINTLPVPVLLKFRQDSRSFTKCSTLLASYLDVHVQDMKKRLDILGNKYLEARELMEDARQSRGSIYFSDDVDDAKAAVTEALSFYKSFLDSLEEEVDKQQVIKKAGLKMEELKGEWAQLEQSLKE